MIIVNVFVPGAAKTKGSMVIRNRRTGAMKESVIGSSPWRALMAAQVRDDLTRRAVARCNCGSEDCAPMPYTGPVRVTVDAALRPPEDPGQDAPTIRRTWYRLALATLQHWAAAIWEQSGDVDKIARNVLDALGSKSLNLKMNGGAIADDVLVVELIARKRVASEQYPAGVQILVETV